MDLIRSRSRSRFEGAGVDGFVGHPWDVSEVPAVATDGPARTIFPPGLAPGGLVDDGDAWVDRMVVAVSRGQLDEVDAALVGAPRDLPAVHLLRAEIRLRTFTTTTSELVGLRDRVARCEPVGGPLWVWASAIVADHLLLTSDPLAIPLVVGAIGELPAGRFPRLPEAYARARLLRLSSLLQLLAPAGDVNERYRHLHDQAITLLMRYGLMTEVTVSSAFAAAVRAVAVGEDPFAAQVLLRAARRQFADEATSWWPTLLDYLLATVSIMLSDFPESLAAIERLERSAPPGQPGDFPRQAYAYMRVCADGAATGALREARAAADSTTDPHHRALFQRHIAMRLADHGHPEALEFGHGALALPPIGPVDALEHSILEARLALLATGELGAKDAFETLRALADSGRRRRAAVFALHLAHDAHRAGRDLLARQLRGWGIERIPVFDALTPDEAVASRPLGALRPYTAGLPPRAALPAAGEALKIAVLQPRLQVRRDGHEIVFSLTTALLLVTLAHAHPAPLHVEVVHDVLWPGEQVRPNRLNTVVHRLRATLGPSREAVVREGPLLRLDPTRCHVDLWDFRSRLDGPPHERARALTEPRGNLCNAEFPYVEHLVDARHQLASTWLNAAREALNRGKVTVPALANAAAALEAAPAGVHPMLSDAPIGSRSR
jgi:hypothetical protein